MPINHPWFGRAFPCICRVMEAQGRRKEWITSTSGLSPLLRGKTLANFDDKRQPKAFEAACELITGKATQPWLLLQGGSGLGKTHLAAAIVNALINQGIQATYAYVPDMLERLRFGYEDGTFRQQWDFLRAVQVLVLDDIMEHQTEWVQEQFTGLLDYRLRECGPTVVSMNLSLGEMPPRVRSRLSDGGLCRMVLLQGKDFRMQAQARVPQAHVSIEPLPVVDENGELPF